MPHRSALVRLVSALVLVLLLSPLTGSVPRAQADDVRITVSGASDLTPAFEEIGKQFTAETGIGVDFNFGSTGQLAQQIEAGAPVDVFAAANVSFVDRLDEQGLIISDTKALYARGRIVLWVRPDSDLQVTTLEDLLDPEIERIAIANPDHAPYGMAAREAMQSAGVWDQVQDKVILGENVSDTLRYAETGNVDVAIVALSLAIQGDGDWELIPDDLHAPIDQALAVIASTKHEAEARAFAEYVNSEAGREIMQKYGFVLPGEAVPHATPVAATPVA